MSDQKPLPAIPTAARLTSTLSIEAQSHRARLIRHILSEIQESGIENRRDGWAHVLEEVLDDVGQCMGRGDWLDGIKRGRELRRAAREEHLKEKEQSQKLAAETVKGKKAEATPKIEEPPQKAEPATLDAAATVHLARGTDGHSEALRQLQALASRPAVQSSVGPSVYHLLLCVASFGSRAPVPSEDSGFDLIPANIGCVFAQGRFLIPSPEAEIANTSSVLYGLSEWDVNAPKAERDAFRLVGGTFTFKGLNSPLQQHLLSKALRMALYIHMSLILEQHFLSDSSVKIRFPRPKLMIQSKSVTHKPQPITKPHDDEQAASSSPSKPRSFLPPSILSFFSRRQLGLRPSKTINVAEGRGASLDLSLVPSAPATSEDRSPRSSLERAASGIRLRRFSFMGDRRPSLRKTLQAQAHEPSNPDKPFASALKRISDSRGLLSTSVGVLLALPTLLVDLVEKEKAKPGRRLNGDERVGLSSLLGWDGKDARGKGMSGILGFVRQQEFSILYSQHVPPASTPSESDEASRMARTASSSSSGAGATPSNLPTRGLRTCGRPHWITYRYYSRDPEEDRSLGEAIIDLVTKAELPCEQPGCQYRRGQHELRLIHGGVRIVIHVDNQSEEELLGEKGLPVEVWESCAVCSAKTSRTNMNNGAYLFSFAKYLELLVYSPPLCTLTPPLCEHTTPPPGPWPTLPTSRLNIKRHFSTPTTTVSFSISVLEDIFELAVPRLQITRGSDKASRTSSTSNSVYKDEHEDMEDEKKVLRREIKRWWEGVADHIDKLEHILIGDDLNAFRKALPRLPSEVDPYEDADTPHTPKASSIVLPPLPPTTPNSPSVDIPKEYFPMNAKHSQNTSDSSSSSKTPTASSHGSDLAPETPPKDVAPSAPHKGNSAELLSTLRRTFQQTEQSLYAQLSRVPVSSLNDVRRSFISAAKGAQRRLTAWQKKHLALKAHLVGPLSVEEPEWWGKGCHAIPGGNITVREDDWGSIIAFTLSTADYHRELANLSIARTSSTSSSQATPSEASPSAPAGSSFFSAATGYRLFSSSANKQPDPDQEGVIWHEPEPFSAVISRKEHPRDPTSLLSIREVLRQKSPIDVGGALPISRFGSLSNASSHMATGAPPSAWAKPDVSVSMQAADGEVSGLPDAVGAVEKIFHEIEASSSEPSRPGSIISDGYTTSSSGIDAHIRRGKASSIISAESDATIGKEGGSALHLQLPPPPPPKDNVSPGTQKETAEGTTSAGDAQSSSFASSLASSLGAAMRVMVGTHQLPRASSPFLKNHHGLLLADAAGIDEQPHIKYDWTIGKRLKFSCTAYYAKQFDTLRRRCGVDDVFLKSLSRSTNWAAEGGKSKSNFWKTADDRFIIKTLVNAWNVADLQVLIELGPLYFRYIESTASKPTVLAKLLGFYTIEIRNLETGAVQSKADLLVMENLFYDRNVIQTFDLKGIQGRKVKAGAITADGTHTSKTLFDGEWIEGQQRTLTLVRPHSKNVIREAIKSDTDFLSKSNMMDYSLLLGVDEERKQIACGLVDTIGSYTFAKTLEYKAKQGLSSGKEVTVIPPAEYQERFISALEGYFLACPDKWSKPVDESKIVSDPNLLPSVL